MKLREILSPSFRDYRRPHTPLVVVATDSDFCRETVDSGVLTAEQMAHAAARYRLGKSKSGRCIFWMIDEAGKVRDGRIGNEWVSAMMEAREPVLLKGCRTVHCLYGLHLVHTENNGHTESTESTEIFYSLRFKSHRNSRNYLMSNGKNLSVISVISV